MSTAASAVSSGYGTKENPIVYRLQVDTSTKTVRVSMSPPRYHFDRGEYVKFDSNVHNAAIRFVSKKSPFYNDEITPHRGHPRPGEVFELGKDGRVCEVLCSKGMSRFECGYVENGIFETWPHGEGADTPGGGY